MLFKNEVSSRRAGLWLSIVHREAATHRNARPSPRVRQVPSQCAALCVQMRVSLGSASTSYGPTKEHLPNLLTSLKISHDGRPRVGGSGPSSHRHGLRVAPGAGQCAPCPRTTTFTSAVHSLALHWPARGRIMRRLT